MDSKLETLVNEFNTTVNHAEELLSEIIEDMAMQIMVDAFESLDVTEQLNILLKITMGQEDEIIDTLKAIEQEVAEAIFEGYQQNVSRSYRKDDVCDDVQERLNRHIDEAIDNVINGKQSTNQLHNKMWEDLNAQLWRGLGLW